MPREQPASPSIAMSTILAIDETSASPIEGMPAVHTQTHSKHAKFYRPELDALRCVAFLAVFVHHTLYSMSPVVSRLGAFGLSLFFLLSAYLITELLQREKKLTGSIDIRAFYIRRTLRIWPLYFGFLALTILIGVWFPGHRSPWMFVVSFVFFFGNLYVGERGFPNNSASYLWSISVEEQFYLVWPLLNRRFDARRLAIMALLTFPVSAIAIVLLATRPGATNLSIWANPIVEFQIFAWGVLLALALAGRIPQFSVFRRFALLAGGFALWLVAARWFPIDDAKMPGTTALILGYILVGAGCAALFLSVYGIHKSRVPEVLVYLGKRSYGLYVFHELSLECAGWFLNRFAATSSATHHLVFGVAHAGLGLALTIGVSALSYKYFETRFLRWKEKFAIVRSRAV
jgi:peptidoglycan/LPS O-acetylase OafA/YrhL